MQFLIGQRVRVKVPFRDNFGKVVPNQFTTACGVCEFVGPNPRLGWELQITIGRMPVKVEHVNDIEIME